jgi:molybdopterin-binding protein
MTRFRIGEVADVLGMSPDTVRRWVDAGRLPATRDRDGRRFVDGADLAAFARASAGRSGPRTGAGAAAGTGRTAGSSARNRLPGIVTEVVRDAVMAQVEIAAGPYRVVSLMSREAADELGLEAGVRAVAVVKSTNVVVEVP